MSTQNIPTSDQEWREKLSPEQYDVMRRKGTERPFTGEYVDVKDDGIYRCAGCGAELFGSDTKFESGTGWPSFTDPAVADERRAPPRHEPLHGPHRGDVRPLRLAPRATSSTTAPAQSGQRYCINSCALDLDRETPTS